MANKREDNGSRTIRRPKDKKYKKHMERLEKTKEKYALGEDHE